MFGSLVYDWIFIKVSKVKYGYIRHEKKSLFLGFHQWEIQILSSDCICSRPQLQELYIFTYVNHFRFLGDDIVSDISSKV